MAFGAILALLAVAATTEVPTRGILNQPAPKWEVRQWFNLPEGKLALEVADFQNKVIYLYCFQSWCPGCHRHGFPTLQRVIKQFKDDPNVAIVAVQTTFEGFSHNGIRQAKKVARQYKLTIPVGQSGTPSARSKLMVNYRTGGTPWTVIIDRNGIVRYNDFHIHPQQAIKLIKNLKKNGA